MARTSKKVAEVKAVKAEVKAEVKNVITAENPMLINDSMNGVWVEQFKLNPLSINENVKVVFCNERKDKKGFIITFSAEKKAYDKEGKATGKTYSRSFKYNCAVALKAGDCFKVLEVAENKPDWTSKKFKMTKNSNGESVLYTQDYDYTLPSTGEHYTKRAFLDVDVWVKGLRLAPISK